LPGERIIYKARHGPLSAFGFLPAPLAIATNRRFMIVGGLLKRNSLCIFYDSISAVRTENKLFWSSFILHMHGKDRNADRNVMGFMGKRHSLALYGIISNQVAYAKGEPPISAYDPSSYAYLLPKVTGPSLTRFVRREKAEPAKRIREHVAMAVAMLPKKKRIVEHGRRLGTAFSAYGRNVASLSSRLELGRMIPKMPVREIEIPVHRENVRVRAAEPYVQRAHAGKSVLNPDRDLKIFRIRHIRNTSAPPAHMNA